jgi:EAL and modified HD-GYP domain-containing signal transduction protein
MLNTFAEIGLERIAGPRRVFLNMTRSLLLDLPEIPFDKDRLVLEILEDIPVDQALIDRVTSLGEAGYTLALDDFEFEDRWLPLLPHIHILKVEVPSLDWERVGEQIARIHRHGLLLLAEKVETEEEYLRLRDLDFDLFQGYHFSRPQIFSGKRLRANQLITLQLLAQLNDPEVTPEQLEILIVQDPGLVFKILRYLNSAAMAMPRTVESIRQAINYLGLERLRGWASLIALSRVEDKPEELFTIALVRAHLCALLTASVEPRERDAAFTVGLLSVIDLLMDQPMETLLASIPLAPTIERALLSRQGAAGEALACALVFEGAGVPPASYPGRSHAEIQELFLQASEIAFREQESLLGG